MLASVRGRPVLVDLRRASPFTTAVKRLTEFDFSFQPSLRREQLTTVPGTFGDPVRVVENLPGMAPEAVQAHVANARRKLGAATTADAIAAAVAWGLLD